MGANAYMNMDPATYGLTTKEQCREKISRLQIEIAKLKEDLVLTKNRNKQQFLLTSKESEIGRIKNSIASRQTDIVKIKAHMAKL